MLMRIFRMEANRRTVAFVIAPDHVAACQSYMDAAQRDPQRYPQSAVGLPGGRRQWQRRRGARRVIAKSRGEGQDNATA